jgi:hypothetical protein
MAEAQDGMSEADALQREILALREKAETVATELSHRFQHTFDVRARLREHRGSLIGVGVGVVAIATAVTLLKMRSARRRRSLPQRLGRKWQALRQIALEPEKIVHRTRRYKPDYGRVFTALILAGIGIGTRLVLRRISA